MNEKFTAHPVPGLTLHWERAEPVRTIGASYHDRTLLALEECFGAFPMTIRREDLKVLRALATVGAGRPIREVIEAVEKEGAIRIWWEARMPDEKARNRYAAVLD